MNRYRPGGPSKASATTVCQKCLKKGHFSYECTASQQERPYISRPSRTQQLLNPKLAPKITEAEPKKAERKSNQEGADSRGRKRSSQDVDERGIDRKRSRSISSHSSDSVSTISTNNSRSRSPPQRSNRRSPKTRERSPVRDRSRSNDRTRRHRQRSRSPRRGERDAARHRSVSRDDPRRTQQGRRRSDSRSSLGDDGARSRHTHGQSARPEPQNSAYSKDRSLSPYSKRQALLQETHK